MRGGDGEEEKLDIKTLFEVLEEQNKMADECLWVCFIRPAGFLGTEKYEVGDCITAFF